MAQNVRQEVTQRIIDAIEAGGLPPWQKGWADGGLAYNATTEKPYTGVNQLLLGMADFGVDQRYLTLKQANALGYKVRRGERATRLVRLVEVKKEGPQSELAGGEVLSEEGEKRMVLKTFAVFNASQIEGMPPLPPRAGKPIESVAAVDAVSEGMKRSGLVILHGAQGACYIPKLDTVRMPDQNTFNSTEDYASTMLHELAHATGSPKRMGRLLPMGTLSDKERAREELRAELASAMLGAELGLPLGESHIESHAAYLSSWLDLLKHDKNEIFVAAAQAQKISDYLRTVAVKPEAHAENATTPAEPEADNPSPRFAA